MGLKGVEYRSRGKALASDKLGFKLQSHRIDAVTDKSTEQTVNAHYDRDLDAFIRQLFRAHCALCTGLGAGSTEE